MSQLREWINQNSTLVYFLIAQAFAIATGGVAIITYAVKLENRVYTMETRGAQYTVDRIEKIDERITILEQITRANADSINRIVQVMTRELGKNPSGR